MAVYLKREGGPTSKAHHRTLKETDGGIKVDRLHVRQVGRRSYGQPVLRLMSIIFARDDCQVASPSLGQPLLTVYHQGDFAQCHPMNHWNGQPPYTRFMLHVQYRAIHMESVGIGPVEYDHLLAMFGTGIH